MKKRIIISIVAALTILPSVAGTRIYLKKPGGKTECHELKENGANKLIAADGVTLPVNIEKISTKGGDTEDVTLRLTATEPCWFNIEQTEVVSETPHGDCDFYMPGFWYHHNLRSPEGAPSFKVSDSWTVREDRLSTPLTGIYDPASKKGHTVIRTNRGSLDCTEQNQSGDVILSGKTSVGFTGFRNESGKPALVFGYPYSEAPKRYIRKLTLIDPVRTFAKMDKGETCDVSWQIREFDAKDYSDFVADIWNYSYDSLKPSPVDNDLDKKAAKDYLANYFADSFVDNHELKYFSCAGLRTADCDHTGDFEIGFVGRVLLNAFNAIEYGYANNRPDLVAKGEAIYSSVLEHGFSPEGFFLEAMNLNNGNVTDVFSIRRQAEGVFAVLNYLDYEKKAGRNHPEWEKKMNTLLGQFIKLQNEDGSFPRKFKGDLSIVDPSGGSTPSATVPLVMAKKYFGEKGYLNSALKSADYLEKEIIDKADYFSSTLDANCEDKEASLYASTAMYYLARATKGKDKKRFMDLSRKAAYFCLSWYYLWDVPFAEGQMLGDVDFKSRGWGNVSVENNHIDVFIFEFATVLEHLADYFGENRFSDFANVIQSSMLQLMPRENYMFDIAKKGYYPEVVQHTTWDYGRNGKGFYNDIFAPGWTVASLWQMLSPERVDNF